MLIYLVQKIAHMKNIFHWLTIFSLFAFWACDDDNTNQDNNNPKPKYDYKITIEKPSIDLGYAGDSLPVKIMVESLNEEFVHHVEIKMFNMDDSTILFQYPSDPKVEAEGKYEYEGFIYLSPSIITNHSNWQFEVNAWGKENYEGLVNDFKWIHVMP